MSEPLILPPDEREAVRKVAVALGLGGVDVASALGRAAVRLFEAEDRAEAAEGKLTAIAEFCHEQEACPRCGCGASLVKAAVHILAIIGSGEKGGDPDDDSFDGPVL